MDTAERWAKRLVRWVVAFVGCAIALGLISNLLYLVTGSELAYLLSPGTFGGLGLLVILTWIVAANLPFGQDRERRHPMPTMPPPRTSPTDTESFRNL